MLFLKTETSFLFCFFFIVTLVLGLHSCLADGPLGGAVLPGEGEAPAELGAEVGHVVGAGRVGGGGGGGRQDDAKEQEELHGAAVVVVVVVVGGVERNVRERMGSFPRVA